MVVDEEIQRTAIEYARRNKEKIARSATDPGRFQPDARPLSVFMAGSPGAGKTEFSKNLVSLIEEGKSRRVVRIDSDEYRDILPGYNGSNAYLFQGASSMIVEKIHDYALHQSQSFLFDSTFSHYAKAAQNIRRSLNKNRGVLIFYLFQLPEVAWRFTQLREKIEGRHISKSDFINAFLGSKKSIEQVLIEFNSNVTVFYVKKDFLQNHVENIEIIQPNTTSVDTLVGKTYTREELETIL